MDNWYEYIKESPNKLDAVLADEARERRKALRANHAAKEQERRAKIVTFQLELEAYALACNTPISKLATLPNPFKVRDLYNRLIMLGVSKVALLEYADKYGLRALFVERSL